MERAKYKARGPSSSNSKNSCQWANSSARTRDPVIGTQRKPFRNATVAQHAMIGRLLKEPPKKLRDLWGVRSLLESEYRLVGQNLALAALASDFG